MLCMEKIRSEELNNCIGIDLYNVATTGKVSKTLNSIATDSDHIPCVVIPIEGNGSRESYRGNGYGGVGNPMFTLNTTEIHAVAIQKRG